MLATLQPITRNKPLERCTQVLPPSPVSPEGLATRRTLSSVDSATRHTVLLSQTSGSTPQSRPPHTPIVTPHAPPPKLASVYPWYYSWPIGHLMQIVPGCEPGTSWAFYQDPFGPAKWAYRANHFTRMVWTFVWDVHVARYFPVPELDGYFPILPADACLPVPGLHTPDQGIQLSAPALPQYLIQMRAWEMGVEKCSDAVPSYHELDPLDVQTQEDLVFSPTQSTVDVESTLS